jgi:hypothetical protein
MKQNVSPVVAVIAIVLVVGLAVVAWTKMGGVENKVGEKPPGMPPSAAAKWNEITSGQGSGQGGSSIPVATGGGPGSNQGAPVTGSPMPGGMSVPPGGPGGGR